MLRSQTEGREQKDQIQAVLREKMQVPSDSKRLLFYSGQVIQRLPKRRYRNGRILPMDG